MWSEGWPIYTETLVFSEEPVSIRPFVHGAKVETMLRDWQRLRDAIRQHGTPEIQDAWDDCERWISAVTPETEGE